MAYLEYYSAPFDAAGPFHPNKKGHKVEAGGAIPAVCSAL